MSNFLKLARGLNKYNSGAYDGYVIAKLEWKISGTIKKVDANILREHRTYCQIKATGFDESGESGFLIITMLGGRTDVAASNEVKISADLEPLTKLNFLQEEVLNYLDAVQDTNPIHKGEGAIVPGGMVLAALQDSVDETIPWFMDEEVKFVAEFLAPIYVGEAFTIAKSPEGIAVHTLRHGECIRISKKISGRD